jgi:putative peptidoglycan lipid II flippase
LLAVFLLWAASSLEWIDVRGRHLQRVVWLALCLAASVMLYFGALMAAGVNLRQLLRR